MLLREAKQDRGRRRRPPIIDALRAASISTRPADKWEETKQREIIRLITSRVVDSSTAATTTHHKIYKYSYCTRVATVRTTTTTTTTASRVATHTCCLLTKMSSLSSASRDRCSLSSRRSASCARVLSRAALWSERNTSEREMEGRKAYNEDEKNNQLNN